MPAAGVELRSEQLAFLAGLQHDRATDPRIGELLSVLEGSDLVSDPTSVPAVNVREMRYDYERDTRMPRALAAELARTTALAHQEWVAARQDADFTRFRPWLDRIVSLKRNEAEAIGYTREPYDALLDEHEPGMTTADIAMLFTSIREDLVPLVADLRDAEGQHSDGILHRDFPVDRQRVLAEGVAASLGFDRGAGRFDTSAHPFCSGIGPGDCRITLRFRAHDLSEGLFGVLHETGHALYDQGLDPAHHGTPMGEPASLGIHESQSRLWENLVGRSAAFWEYLSPRLRDLFHETLPDANALELFRAANRVGASANRVRADQVTYNLHVIIRFEIERGLIAGDLAAGDVPAAWNEGYRRYLGITPDDDAAGCLQDMHWASGLIGYFPTYTLGDVFAAQLFAAASSELGDLEGLMRRGDFRPLLDWLRRTVHRQGRRYRGAELVQRATGRPPDPRLLTSALRQKFGELYGL